LVLLGGWIFFAQRPSEPSTLAQTSAVVATAAAPVPVPSAQDRIQQDLEQARREQKAALEEAARLRGEAEARRKADEEAALRHKIEGELRQKADAEESARRQAAEAEAKRKAEAETAARLKAEEVDRQDAVASEQVLHLAQPDRQRIQVALTALGFDTAGNDGVFGPRSREMIAAWQKKGGRAATGYLAPDTQAALLREAGPALARYDEEQKKLADTRQALPSQSAGTPVASAQDQSSSAKGGGQCEGTWHSQWCRNAFQGFPPSCWNSTMTIRGGEISDGWPNSLDRTQRNVVTGRIDASGTVIITYNGIGQQTYTNQHFTAAMTGKVTDGVLTAVGRGGTNGREFTVHVQCR
jgi:peptidoglycan hydrolase-like protein with peptidoglycan-binding domain